jgi:DMSO reductase anchor subunit
MHPAYSVIVFTCASGAGYGLLAWLGLDALWHGRRPTSANGIAFVLAFALVTVGLLSSTAHLGRPERAWRAFSQWRTSWLSREGVLALATYAAGALVVAHGFLGPPDDVVTPRVLGLATAVAALATVWSTGMIYASLKTIRAWHHPLVAPLYVLLALATGRLSMNAVAAALEGPLRVGTIWATLLLLLAGWIAKSIYWNDLDEAPRTHTIGDATGLGRFGQVRVLEPPHTQANFVMREMGYDIARKHALRLRQIASLLLFVVPVICCVAMLAVGATPGLLLSIVAVAAAAAGVGVERWLFFAEARHVAMLYYGRDTA